MIENNLYINLLSQAQKLYRHCNLGAIQTRKSYAEIYQRFLKFLAEHYRLQKIANISGKHLTAYISYMQERGLAAATIKTNLSGIRFWHDQVPGAKYRLPKNDAYDLERREFGGKDRTWSGEEFDRMLKVCRRTGHADYESCIILARYLGLRIHECERMDTAIARDALKKGVLTIKGKGGKVRKIPVRETARTELERAAHRVPAGHKLFVPADIKTHVSIKELQNFIGRHRNEVQDPGSTRPLTFHGLRHTYAAEQYERLTAKGMTDFQARRQVSQWLGHERDDVTRIYLASITEEGDGDI